MTKESDNQWARYEQMVQKSNADRIAHEVMVSEYILQQSYLKAAVAIYGAEMAVLQASMLNGIHSPK